MDIAEVYSSNLVTYVDVNILMVSVGEEDVCCIYYSKRDISLIMHKTSIGLSILPCKVEEWTDYCIMGLF